MRRGHTRRARLVAAQGQPEPVYSDIFDRFNVHDEGSTRIVFDPGHRLDVIRGFAVAGGGHDILDLPASDFTSIADVLHNTRNTAGAPPRSPTPSRATRSGSAFVTKADLAHHKQDLSFHG